MAKKQNTWRRERRQRARKVRRQSIKANVRAKYGPRMKPQPVTITRPGFKSYTVDPSRLQPEPVAPTLEAKARAAGYATYAAYLVSPEWKARRREVLQRDGWRCVRCWSKTKLHVHHRWYGRIGAEPLKSLETLCQGCHQRLHNSHG